MWGGCRIEAGDGGQGERGFFGKGANPITGSGAALVSLAALNSHFNGLVLPLPVPLYLRLSYFSTFSCISSHHGSHSHPLTMHLHAPHASLSPFVSLSLSLWLA